MVPGSVEVELEVGLSVVGAVVGAAPVDGELEVAADVNDAAAVDPEPVSGDDVGEHPAAQTIARMSSRRRMWSWIPRCSGRGASWRSTRESPAVLRSITGSSLSRPIS